MLFDPNAYPPIWSDGLHFNCDRHPAKSLGKCPISSVADKTPQESAPDKSPFRPASASPPAETFLRQEPWQHAGLVPIEPVFTPQASQVESGSPSSLQDCRVLIVEDDADNRFYAECAVEDFGCQWASTGLGDMALPLAIAYRPNVILLDIWLKETTGFEVIRQLQQNCQTLHIPTIAVTALSMPRELNQISTAGFAGYLLKPYLLEDLSRALSAHLPRPTHQPSQSNQASRESC